MKKFISVLMCAVLMLILTSCGGAGEESGISRGTIIGNVYTNESADFTFNKPAGWNYLTDEEIAETINLGQEALDLNMLEEALAEKSTVYDMVAMDPAYGNSVMVCYENTKLTAGYNLSADEYLEQLKKQLDNVDAFSYEFVSSDNSVLSGTTFTRGIFKTVSYGSELYQAYYVKAVGNYIVTVIVTATSESIESIEAMFNADSAATADTDEATHTTEDEEEKTPLSRGDFYGDDYVNKFAGFTFSKPESWYYNSDEEIAETVNIGQEALDLNKLEEALAKEASIYDMAASDPDYGNSVMVCYENTRLTGALGISEEEYVESLKTLIQNTGVYDYEFISSEDTTLSGTPFKKAVFKAYPEGVEINQAYYIKAVDNYIVAVIITATTESIEDIEAMFI